MADEGLGQVDEFRARGKETPGLARLVLPTSRYPKGALALALGGEKGPG